jgi:hypothetical protein
MHWQKNLFDLLDIYGLENKIITYVKNKGSTLTIVLKFIVKCEGLNLKESFQRTFLSMFFPKPINTLPLMIKFIGRGLKYVFVKCAHVVLHKCNNCLNKSSKGWQEWNKACVETNLRPRKLNILMKTMLVFFRHFVFYFISLCKVFLFWSFQIISLILDVFMQVCIQNYIVPRGITIQGNNYFSLVNKQ